MNGAHQPDQISAIFLDYYQKLFSSSNPKVLVGDLDSIPRAVTVEMNKALTEEFQAWEVESALKQMAPLKTLGPDGMPPLFYQNFWELVRGDVIHDVLIFLNSGTLPNSLNHTFITLIPKTKNPENVTEYRPISLCNVLYKIFSKVLANRLKRVLPQIISEHQSAFIKGRLITDNSLVAFETLHYMKNHNSGNSSYMALKLDMSKAYDRVEWSFLKDVMIKMGFNDRWVALIMECISSVTYSLLINGEPFGNIKPSRGIRQGDPFSPYLFMLCSKGFHRMIQKATEKGEIQGVSICRNGPKLTHLFFTNDSLLFCRATTHDCQKVLEILSNYERVSGQKLNREKTAFFFSKSTPSFMDLLGVNELKQYEEYLGLPALVRMNKRASFDRLKQKVWKRLQGWEGKLLSQAGREVHIKSVIQAIPTFIMSCFKLPTTLCHEIETLIRKFWWGQRGERRKVHWVKWGDLCQDKGQGGIGFKDLTMFNEAMLAKLAWRLLHDDKSFFYRVFKARFFPRETILEAKDSSSASYAWKSILKGRDVILKGALWRIGDGKRVRILGDNWLP